MSLRAGCYAQERAESKPTPLGRRGPPLARTTLRLPPNRACAFQRTRLSVPLDLRSESLAGSCSNRRWMISACISRTFPLIVPSTQNCRPSPDRSAVSVRSPVPYALGRPPHRRLSRPLSRAFEFTMTAPSPCRFRLRVVLGDPVVARVRSRGVFRCLVRLRNPPIGGHAVRTGGSSLGGRSLPRTVMACQPRSPSLTH